MNKRTAACPHESGIIPVQLTGWFCLVSVIAGDDSYGVGDAVEEATIALVAGR